ncbi:MAG: hypothetical protein DRJ10_13985 [Bacteroidetes bacterium]|nr:MAG: hypothetical protein DRJ10_13985 [Bacteroidota bacterium]RLD83439.1 MAG: hypothetical protein DRJ07_06660 [Bacteroidota bacterium]
MNRIKKLISLIVIALFLSALTLNLHSRKNQIISTANADVKCPGWDGYSAFCGWVGDENEPCQIVADCYEVCLYGC